MTSFGALTSLVLFTFSRRDRPAFAQPAVIWISSACVLASILALALFLALSYLSPLIALVGGGVFGIYSPSWPYAGCGCTRTTARPPSSGTSCSPRWWIDHAVVHRGMTRRGWRAASSHCWASAPTR
ncbi:MAG: hypothetical protein ACLSVD_02690 [Eggerthellaceae bacterium]